jgi:NAD(P)-dependent dehydrogenase (short-subunit alcohol dehydrogenase family)
VTAAPAGTGRLAGRIALVTGASRGIGRAVALRFAREGAHVVVVARTQGGLEEVDDEIRAAGGRATLVPGDLTQFDVIDRIGGALYDRWGRLDIVVGNAASLGVLGPVAETAPATWDQVMALNVTANWRLIRSVDPLLRASGAGRAIFVTDRVSSGRAYWGAYAVSKAALETMVRTYAAEVARSGVRANLIDPGPTRTVLRAAAFPGEDPETLLLPEAVTDGFVALAAADCSLSGEIVDGRPDRSPADAAALCHKTF